MLFKFSKTFTVDSIKCWTKMRSSSTSWRAWYKFQVKLKISDSKWIKNKYSNLLAATKIEFALAPADDLSN